MALQIRIDPEIKDRVRKAAMRLSLSNNELVNVCLAKINWETVDVEKTRLVITLDITNAARDYV